MEVFLTFHTSIGIFSRKVNFVAFFTSGRVRILSGQVEIFLGYRRIWVDLLSATE